MGSMEYERTRSSDETKTTKKKKKKEATSPPLPWKTKIFVSLISFVGDVLRRRDGTLHRRLTTLLDHRRPPSPTHSSTRRTTSRDLVLDPSRPLSVRVYLPPARHSSPLPVIVFFHGGGFVFLSASSRHYHFVCRRFSLHTPAVVVSVDYRLAPEHRFPAPYLDGLDVLRFLDSTEDPVLASADLHRCFLAGDSAGGNIAHHVARRWCAEGYAASARRVRLAGLVAIQPFFGGEGRVVSEKRLRDAPLVNVERTDWMWRAFLPEGEDRDHGAANVFGPRGDGELGDGFPPAMVVVGGFDPLQDWQRRYAAGLRERGKEVTVLEYPAAIHAFYLFPELPDAGKFIGELRAFVEKCTLKCDNCSQPSDRDPSDISSPPLNGGLIAHGES